MWSGAGFLSRVEEMVKRAEGHRSMAFPSTFVGGLLLNASEPKEQTRKAGDSPKELKVHM